MQATLSLTMVRTICCEAYKQCGRRCAICPNRPENRQAVVDYKQAKLMKNNLAGFCKGESCQDCRVEPLSPPE